MKIRINHYLFKIIKENITYILAFLVIIIIFLSSVIIIFNKFRTFNEKIDLTTKEINELKKKAEFVNYQTEILQEGIDLKIVNKILTELIPNEEDFFSVISALEEISKQTNFIIVSYVINIKASTAKKLALTVEGVGDNQSFFKFLEDYRYIGRRLITIDKIDYNTTALAKIKLNINFYNGKETTSKSAVPVKLSEKDKKLVNEILSKVRLDMKAKEDTTSYPFKNNPF